MGKMLIWHPLQEGRLAFGICPKMGPGKTGQVHKGCIWHALKWALSPKAGIDIQIVEDASRRFTWIESPVWENLDAQQ
jgi:hypothetical protein